MKNLITFLFLLPLVSFSQNEKPNFVFLLVDDLGWGDFGCYGATFNETPNIDKLSKEGMLFTNAYAACTVCSPSRAAILTGKYPARLQLTDWITGHEHPYAKLKVPEWKTKIDHDEKLLPEVMKDAGYKTAFLGKWHLMPIGKDDFEQHYPTNHGFDINVGGREWGQPKGRGKYFSPFDMPNLNNGQPGDYLTDKLTDAALDILDSISKDPFLMYFSYYSLHGPVMSPPELVSKYKNKAKKFDNKNNEYINPARSGMVEKLDQSVGRLMNKLDELGVSENTVVILTGDNGGNYDETTRGLRGYKGFSHEGGTREPFLIKWPNKIKAGSVNRENVIGTDIFPTILDIANLPLEPNFHKDGVSLLPLISGETKKFPRENLFWHYPHYHRTKPYGAVLEGKWKLIEFFEDGRLELYNLKSDPFETINLANSEKKVSQRLLRKMQSWRVDVGAQMMEKNPNYDPEKADKKRTKKKKGS